ncbi:hypothetical protein L6164_007391 [Bauhinia variegata]|uniref:Uncharacterized protein n=1 Tax=Bauhinia variegata TaxID=167791 RepID=A0ACB9PG86_BAUVA|nr:hypothetical protein L6164_007391 [Bauhinia variegata]
MTWRHFYRDVVLFAVMIIVEFSNVGSNTLFKAATDRGLSYHVYIVYSYAVSTLVLLLPLPLIIRRTTGLPSINSSLLFRILLLGAIDVVSALCGYRGLEYSSPTLASAAGNLMPAFTFILAVFFRMEKVDLRGSSTQAKIMGTLVSISGALIVVLYKGPTILSPSQPPKVDSQLSSPSHTNWVLGGSLLALQYLIFSVWYIMQAQVMKLYPSELIVVFLYNLFATLISAPVCFLAEPNLSSWRLNPDITMVSIIYSGIFFTCLSVLVHTCCTRLKGPVYVSIFKPLSIGIAAASGVIFLGDALYLGSVVGGVILSIGFYAAIWGKAKEEPSEDRGIICTRTPSNSKTPLLQSCKVEDNRETLALGGKC